MILTTDAEAEVTPLETMYLTRALDYVNAAAQLISRRAEDDTYTRQLALSIAAEKIRQATK